MRLARVGKKRGCLLFPRPSDLSSSEGREASSDPRPFDPPDPED